VNPCSNPFLTRHSQHHDGTNNPHFGFVFGQAKMGAGSPYRASFPIHAVRHFVIGILQDHESFLAGGKDKDNASLLCFNVLANYGKDVDKEFNDDCHAFFYIFGEERLGNNHQASSSIPGWQNLNVPGLGGVLAFFPQIFVHEWALQCEASKVLVQSLHAPQITVCGLVGFVHIRSEEFQTKVPVKDVRVQQSRTQIDRSR